MANNRLWLVNKRTGDRTLIAKYYPSTGWYVHHEIGLSEEVAGLLDGEPPEPSMWGNAPLRLEYEQEPEQGPLPDPLAQPKGIA